MKRFWPNRIHRRLLCIQSDQVSIVVRGFAPSKLQGHLESMGAAFLQGYYAALDDASLAAHSDPFGALPADYRGFALEGAAMAFNVRTMPPIRTLVGDFNEDGAADVLVYFWGRTPVVFLQRTARSAAGALSPARFAPVVGMPGWVGTPVRCLAAQVESTV
jgi:hypothetical protein